VRQVAALYVRKNTVYHAFPDVDCWDVMRNARYWPGGCPAICHPPCAQWGVLKGMARRDPDEKALALLAVDQVRINGGVIEHPRGSDLWKKAPLPPLGPGWLQDDWGGYTIAIDQHRFGHRALKPTWLYIVGCDPLWLPAMPADPAEPPKFVLGTSKKKSGRVEIEKWEREATPHALAEWLVELARRCKAPRYKHACL
jgi:hypothetical protein